MKTRTGLAMAESVRLAVEDGIARVTLARPDVRNAFNAGVIAELHDIFARITAADDVRAVVLAGEGKVFCGGADISWMRASLDLSFEENLADAERMSDMFRAIDNCSKPVIGRIHGAALGGGAGLAAVCDIAIASSDAVFGFTEVKLGIIPGGDLAVRPSPRSARRRRARSFSPASGSTPRTRRESVSCTAWCRRRDLDAAVDAAFVRASHRRTVGDRRREAARARGCSTAPTTIHARSRRGRSHASASARKAKKACALSSSGVRPRSPILPRRLDIEASA